MTNSHAMQCAFLIQYFPIELYIIVGFSFFFFFWGRFAEDISVTIIHKLLNRTYWSESFLCSMLFMSSGIQPVTISLSGMEIVTNMNLPSVCSIFSRAKPFHKVWLKIPISFICADFFAWMCSAVIRGVVCGMNPARILPPILFLNAETETLVLIGAGAVETFPLLPGEGWSWVPLS